jgi:hypothetical protein
MNEKKTKAMVVKGARAPTMQSTEAFNRLLATQEKARLNGRETWKRCNVDYVEK